MASLARSGATEFVATAPGRFRERFASVCTGCFEAREACGHHPELPLRLLLVGHNPSLHAYSSGFFYSNPSNRMWALLTGTFGAPSTQWEGIVPRQWDVWRQNALPLHTGVGLTDLGVEAGNDAGVYTPAQLHAWRADLYRALVGHTQRVRGTVDALRARAGEEAREGEEAGEEGEYSPAAPLPPAWTRSASRSTARRVLAFLDHDSALDVQSGAPVMLAFTGKAQWKALFEPPLPTCEGGVQPPSLRPPGWPLPPTTSVYVLPSSSGRAAMRNESRGAPYADLAEWLHGSTARGADSAASGGTGTGQRTAWVRSSARPAGPWLPADLAMVLDAGTDVGPERGAQLLAGASSSARSVKGGSGDGGGAGWTARTRTLPLGSSTAGVKRKRGEADRGGAEDEKEQCTEGSSSSSSATHRVTPGLSLLDAFKYKPRGE